MKWVNVLLLAMAVVLVTPALVLCVECVASLLPRRRSHPPLKPEARPKVAVLIPAHNEQAVLEATLRSLRPALQPQDRVVVVADNCTDDTAAIAKANGAEAIERSDTTRRGKGYALDFGLRHLAETGAPDVLVMVDADCTVDPTAIECLVAQVAATARPAQAVYLMEHPAEFTRRDVVSALAFLVKNWVRPRGLHRLGFPCLLTGTGMAFPWACLSKLDLANGLIVEDMQMGLDQALAGAAPQLCESARVTGRLPEGSAAAVQQRRRWEHGHLQTLMVQVPRLLRGALKTGRLKLIALALELAVPPLSLLVLLMLAGLLIALLGGLWGASLLAVKLLVTAFVMVGLCITAVWAKFASDTVPFLSLPATPFYVLWKIPIYVGYLIKSEKNWVRTSRDTGQSTPPTGGVQSPESAAVSIAPQSAPQAAPQSAPQTPHNPHHPTSPVTSASSSHD